MIRMIVMLLLVYFSCFWSPYKVRARDARLARRMFTWPAAVAVPLCALRSAYARPSPRARSSSVRAVARQINF